MPVTLDVRVSEVRELGGEVRELTLRPTGTEPLPAFSAGSHVVVHLPLAERRRLNAYSITSPPWEAGAYRIAVRRVAGGGGGSAFVHDAVRVGDVLTVEPPRNLFPLCATARHHVLVAGGVGVTPFAAYVHRLVAERGSFELHHAGRENSCRALLDELRELAPGRVHGYGDREALMGALAVRLESQPLGAHLSLCGPPPMMEAVSTLAAGRGWPPSRVHLERFTAVEGPMEPFEVLLGRDGTRLRVAAEESLLEALEAAGLEIPYLCRRGVCGECRTVVLDGTPDHRDVYLDAGERERNTTVMPCVSRCARGPLVLDLVSQEAP